MCVPDRIVSGLMGLAISVTERSVEIPSVDTGTQPGGGESRAARHPRLRSEGIEHMSTANSEPRQSGAAEGSVRQSSQLDQLRLPLVFSVEEAADRLGVGRTLMYSLVSSGAVESVRIGRLRRVPADALVTFLNELRRGIGAGPGTYTLLEAVRRYGRRITPNGVSRLGCGSVPGWTGSTDLPLATR